MNIIEEKILIEEEKYYSYPIKLVCEEDSNFLDQSETNGMIFFGRQRFPYPKFWRSETFKLPFNEFYIREYQNVSFQIQKEESLFYGGEGSRIRLLREADSDKSFDRVFPALNFMGYLWQHFVQDVLPILYFGKDFLNKNPDVIILLYEGISQDIVNYFINSLNIKNTIEYIPYNETIISTNFLYNFESNVGIPTYWWNNFFYKGIHELVSKEKSFRKNLIYTKRLYRRAISNEKEFKDVLLDYANKNSLNFIEFEAEHYTMEERAKIFKDAHTIVSPHGGANYHILFSQPNTKFIEFTFTETMFTLYNIASSINLDYYIIPNSGSNETISFNVDLNKLNKILNS